MDHLAQNGKLPRGPNRKDQPDGPLWDTIERTFRRFVLPDVAGRVQLLPARLGPFAAAIGAAHRCFENLYPVERSSL